MRTNNNAIRTQIYLTALEISYLDLEKKTFGITRSELIRRILDDWIEKKKIS